MQTPAVDLDGYLSTSAAARELKLSKVRLIQLCDAGHVPGVLHTPLGRLVPVAAVRQLAAERAARNAAKTG